MYARRASGIPGHCVSPCHSNDISLCLPPHRNTQSMNLVLTGILAYVALQLVIGAWFTRRNKTEDDYLLAGRSLGLGVSTMTIFATWFGAETCIGAAGAIYDEGLAGGRADPFGYAICVLVLGLFFAAPLWRKKLTTVGDLFRQRFGVGVEKLAVMLMVPTSLLWAAAQIRAFGQVLSASSELDVSVTITIAATVVVAYTVMGGLLADAYTDLVQGITLIVGLIVIGVMVAAGLPDHLEAIDWRERLRFAGEGESWLVRGESWAVPIMGSLFAQEMVTRTLAAKSAEVARRACILASGVYLCVGLIPVMLGVLGPAIIPGLDDPEQLLPMLGQACLPTALYVVFAGALVAAILSTVDSALLASASLISHNIVVPAVRGVTEAGKVRIARIAVVGLGLLAYVLAQHADSVYGLVEEASAFGSAGLFVTVVLGLTVRFGGAASAAASLLAGVAAYVLCAYVLVVDYPYLMSMVAAFAAYGVVSVWERGRVALEDNYARSED